MPKTTSNPDAAALTKSAQAKPAGELANRPKAPPRARLTAEAEAGVSETPDADGQTEILFGDTPAQRPLPRLHSVADVGDMFGRAPRTIRSWIAKGVLQPVRVGRAVFIPDEQLELLLHPPETPTANKTLA